MLARKRVSRSKASKAKVALTAVTGESPARLTSHHGIHATQVAARKRQLVEKVEELFAAGRRKNSFEVSQQNLEPRLAFLPGRP